MTKPNTDTNKPEQDEVSPEELFSQLANEDSTDSEQAQEEQQDEQGKEPEQSDAEESEQGEGGEGQADDDPWAQVDEPLRNQHLDLQQRYAKLEQDHRANAGRVAALNQKTQQLQQQLQAREQQQGKPQGDGPSAEDLEGKTFEEVKEEWPEVAAYIENQQQQMEQRFNQQLEQKLTPYQQMYEQQQQQQQVARIQSEQQRLTEQHPDWQDIARDSKFQQWIQGQSQGVQAMYGSQSADDNIALLNLYKSANGISQQKPTAQRPSRDLSQHTEIPRKGASRQGRVNVDDIPPEQLFTQLASQQKR